MNLYVRRSKTLVLGWGIRAINWRRCPSLVIESLVRNQVSGFEAGRSAGADRVAHWTGWSAPQRRRESARCVTERREAPAACERRSKTLALGRLKRLAVDAAFRSIAEQIQELEQVRQTLEDRVQTLDLARMEALKSSSIRISMRNSEIVEAGAFRINKLRRPAATRLWQGEIAGRTGTARWGESGEDLAGTEEARRVGGEICIGNQTHRGVRTSERYLRDDNVTGIAATLVAKLFTSASSSKLLLKRPHAWPTGTIR